MALRTLVGSEVGRLADALKSAFPKRDKLAQMVLVGLDKNLEDIVPPQSVQAAFDLVEWAESQGETEALIAAAREANPGNPKLREVAEELLAVKAQAASLPARPAWFIGRDALAEELKNALLAEEPKPALILGPAGIGKSTLTLAVLHRPEIAARYGARRYFVRLDAADTADKTAAAIALAMRLPPGPNPRGDMLAALAREKTVLVLDNGETPWEGEGTATEELLGQLAGVPGVGLVVSVRGEGRPGGVRWGKTLRVKPLDDAEALALFCEIADDHRPDDPGVAPLVKKLAGVPLAIELLGRAAQGSPIRILADEWERQRTAMLKRLGAEASRLSSWAVSIELSMDSRRMTPEARRLASVLTALPDGVAESDVQAVLPESGPAAARVLAHVGLAYRDKGRLLLLAPVREHLAQVHPAAESDLDRAMDFYGRLAEELGNKPGGKGGREAVELLAPEVANLEAMLQRGLLNDRGSSYVDRTLALLNFTRFTGQGSAALFMRAQDKARVEGDRRREANCIFGIGVLAQARSEPETARRRYEEAQPLYRQVGDVRGEANCISGLGYIAQDRSEPETARRRYEEAQPLYRQVGDVPGEANCILCLGEIAIRRSEHETARQRYEEAQPLYRQVGDVLGEANCIYGLGDLAQARSEPETARRRYEDAQPLYRQVGSVLGEANCIKGLGDLAQARSEHETARRRYEEAQPLYRQVGDVLGEANCIQRLGDLAQARSEPGTARLFFEEALALYSRIPEPYSIGGAHHRLARVTSGAEQARHVEAARQAWTGIDRPDLVAEFLDDEFPAKP